MRPFLPARLTRALACALLPTLLATPVRAALAQRAAPARRPPTTARTTSYVTAATGLPAAAEDQVDRWSRLYLSKHKGALEQAFEAAQPWAPMIAAKLQAAGLPGALVYLPVIESGYQPWARSRVGAVGLWQFMGATARMYGLRITAWRDDRRDPWRATDAAIRYLRDLYAEHHDWYLALASYNAGSGRVGRAVRVTGGSPWAGHAFWSAQPLLPRETQQYVPQLLAVARVSATPEANGIRVPRAYRMPELVRVSLPRASKLTVVAAVWGLSIDDIARWNPGLQWAATPPNEDYPLVLPAADAAAKRDAFLALPAAIRTLSRAEIAAIEQRARS